MSWKTDLKLADLDEATPLEIACRRCGLTRYETRAQLISNGMSANDYLDEIEGVLQCPARSCLGKIRVSLIYDDKNEGFVGGMA